MSLKIKLFLAVFISILVLTVFVLAADSAAIKNDQFSFSISSSQGIYPLIHLYQDNKSVKTISLCKKDKCTGSLTGNLDLSNLSSGDLVLFYYSFDSYSWKNLSLNAPLESRPSNSSSGVRTLGNSIGNSNSSSSKQITVKSICRLSHIFNSADYTSCLKKYL